MNGFIPYSRASFMLDVVALAMVAIVPTVLFAVGLARAKHYALHKKIMKVVCAVLLVAVVAFELEIRLLGWRELAKPSPFYDTYLFPVLMVHLLFAVTASISLFSTIIFALKRFPTPPMPSPHSRTHRFMGRIAAGSLLMTSITGWIFYWMAFIA